MITLKNITFSYQKGNPIFSNLSYKIDTKETICLVGKNGSGKTTFCRILSDLIRDFDGEVIHDSAVDILYLKQEPYFNTIGATADEDLLITQSKFIKNDDLNLQKERGMLLEKIGFENLQHEPLWERSFGQLKKVGFANAILRWDHFWILDEPFAGLDKSATELLINLLRQRKKENKGTLIVSHEQENIILIANKIVEIIDKGIYEK